VLRQYGIYSKDVGKDSLSFNYNAIPTMSCTSNGCSAGSWIAPDGTSSFQLKSELTDNCLHIYSTFQDTQAYTTFVELYVTF
jgi:hypothetical protein